MTSTQAARKKYRHKYYLKHKAKSIAASNAWRKKYPEKYRKLCNASTRRQRYGPGAVEHYESLKKSQNNRCAICRKPCSKLHQDHCHKTKKLRGGLCYPCNHGLGLFRDSVNLLQTAIKYLRSWS